MPNTPCNHCGSAYHWQWEDAFDKFGFGDGDGQVETPTVALVLRRAGYQVQADRWGMHNTVILSIRRDGIEHIPESVRVGYDDPRRYLPPDIIALLDARLPDEGEAQI